MENWIIPLIILTLYNELVGNLFKFQTLIESNNVVANVMNCAGEFQTDTCLKRCNMKEIRTRYILLLSNKAVDPYLYYLY